MRKRYFFKFRNLYLVKGKSKSYRITLSKFLKKNSIIFHRIGDYYAKDDFLIVIYNEFYVKRKLSFTEMRELFGTTLKRLFSERGFILRTREEDSVVRYEKVKVTNLERFGFENTAQVPELKDKMKKTCMIKYGFTNPMQSSVVKDKTKETNLERYGKEHFLLLSEVRERIKNTCLERHGFEYPAQVPEFKKKIKNTCLDRYGFEYPAQVPEFKEKSKNNSKIHFNEVKESRFKNVFLPHCKDFGYEFLDVYDGITRKVEGKHVSYKKYRFRHIECGTVFEADTQKIPVCPKCFNGGEKGSQLEHYIYNFIRENTSDKVIKSYKIYGKGFYRELDVYIPNKNIAFEINGLSYHSIGHSRSGKTRNYHSEKTDLALENGVNLFHIWGNIPLAKIKSFILNKLGCSSEKVFARKTVFKELDFKTAETFFNTNHFHGNVNSSKYFGLYYEDILLQGISFRTLSGFLEIARFATALDINVIGGFSKLLKNSLRFFPTHDYLVSYCDRDLSPDYKNSVYYKNGFNYVGDTGNILKYTNFRKLFSRQRFQKHKLEGLFPLTFDKDLTADEILSLNRIYPVYNSGNFKFEMSI